MALNKRTQKQVAERLKGNLDYYNRPHYFRSLRFLFSAAALLFGVAAVPAYYYLHGSEEFMNPGPISQRHAQFASDCAVCHTQTAMIKADSHKAGDILRAEYYTFIDKACVGCHQHFDFHVPNTVPDPKRPADKLGAQTENSSCTSCHREHITAERIAPVKDSGCAQCHNRQDLMAASARDVRNHAPGEFPHLTDPKGLIYFPKPRPAEGYTKAFASFENGHPTFQTESEKESGAFDTLRYGHSQHDQSKVLYGTDGKPRVPVTEKGDRLACGYCHKPDGSGQHFQRITFENNCKACHAMPFDPFLPELIIPHGSSENVRLFLRGLESKFIEAARGRGINGGPQLQQFVADAANRVRMRAGGENSYDRVVAALERQIFLSDYYKDAAMGGGPGAIGAPGGGNVRGRAALSTGPDSAMFAGCKLCHQITPSSPGALPQIAKVVIPDRWFQQGAFNHAKHVDDGRDKLLSCRGCHYSIANSTLTSDINLPKQSRGGMRQVTNEPKPGDPVGCTDCHAHQTGGGVSRCTNCHSYHNDPRKQTIDKSTGNRRADVADPEHGGGAGLRRWLFGTR